MRYYSDVTKKFYETPGACIEAEEKVLTEQAKIKEEKERLAAERKSRAAEVEEARKNVVAAQKNYRDVLDAFIKDYKSYHYTSTDADEIPTLFDLFKFF